MNPGLKLLLAAAVGLLSAQAVAQITFYEDAGFRGRMFTTDKAIGNFQRFGFNDRASSVVVDRGRWEVCDDAGFRGHCAVLRRGSYDSLADLGLDDRISSVRPVNARRNGLAEAPPPLAQPNYEYRRRPQERLFEAKVVAVHAVGGPPERRCWVERERLRGEPNVGGAVIGGIVGGILGHQFGSHRGQDAATVAGALAGAAIGSQADRGYGRPVERCETAFSGPPEYYDVVYVFRGVEHHVQMREPPGPTIAVNGNGEPRG